MLLFIISKQFGQNYIKENISFSLSNQNIVFRSQIVFLFLFNDHKTHNTQHRPIRIIHLSDSQGNRTRLMIKRVPFLLSSILIWILSTYAWGTFQKIRKERERERERERDVKIHYFDCWNHRVNLIRFLWNLNQYSI